MVSLQQSSGRRRAWVPALLLAAAAQLTQALDASTQSCASLLAKRALEIEALAAGQKAAEGAVLPEVVAALQQELLNILQSAACTREPTAEASSSCSGLSKSEVIIGIAVPSALALILLLAIIVGGLLAVTRHSLLKGRGSNDSDKSGQSSKPKSWWAAGLPASLASHLCAVDDENDGRDEEQGGKGNARASVDNAPAAGPDTTLLLSDVQNSTSLWEMLPTDTMDECMRLHDQSFRTLLAKHMGYESATEGDAFIIAFPNPAAALRFAMDVQLALLEAPWPAQLLINPDGRPVHVLLDGDQPLHNGSGGRVPGLMSPHNRPRPSTDTPKPLRLGFLQAANFSTSLMLDTFASNRPTNSKSPGKALPWMMRSAQEVDDADLLGTNSATMNVVEVLDTIVDCSQANAVQGLPALVTSTWGQTLGTALPRVRESMAQKAASAVIFRGLRVRMGIHTGVDNRQDVVFDQSSGRTVYSGIAMDIARAVADAAPGGGVLLSTEAFARLPHSLMESLSNLDKLVNNGMQQSSTTMPTVRPSLDVRSASTHRSLDIRRPNGQLNETIGAVALYAGDFVMTKLKTVGSPSNPLSLYMAVPSPIPGRLPWLASTRNTSQHALGTVAAPVGHVTIAFLYVVGASSLLTDHPVEARLALVQLQSACIQELTRQQGYAVEVVDGLILAAFQHPAKAVCWAIRCNQLMQAQVWPQELLNHESCICTDTEPAPWAHPADPAQASTIKSAADHETSDFQASGMAPSSAYGAPSPTWMSRAHSKQLDGWSGPLRPGVPELLPPPPRLPVQGSMWAKPSLSSMMDRQLSSTLESTLLPPPPPVPPAPPAPAPPAPVPYEAEPHSDKSGTSKGSRSSSYRRTSSSPMEPPMRQISRLGNGTPSNSGSQHREPAERKASVDNMRTSTERRQSSETLFGKLSTAVARRMSASMASFRTHHENQVFAHEESSSSFISQTAPDDLFRADKPRARRVDRLRADAAKGVEGKAQNAVSAHAAEQSAPAAAAGTSRQLDRRPSMVAAVKMLSAAIHRSSAVLRTSITGIMGGERDVAQLLADEEKVVLGTSAKSFTTPSQDNAHKQHEEKVQGARDARVLLPGVHLKIGIDLGKCLASVHTTSGRIHYRGKVMNRAARVAARCQRGEVMATDLAWQYACTSGDLLTNGICGDSLGDTELKGVPGLVKLVHVWADEEEAQRRATAAREAAEATISGFSDIPLPVLNFSPPVGPRSQHRHGMHSALAHVHTTSMDAARPAGSTASLDSASWPRQPNSASAPHIIIQPPAASDAEVQSQSSSKTPAGMRWLSVSRKVTALTAFGGFSAGQGAGQAPEAVPALPVAGTVSIHPVVQQRLPSDNLQRPPSANLQSSLQQAGSSAPWQPQHQLQPPAPAATLPKQLQQLELQPSPSAASQAHQKPWDANRRPFLELPTEGTAVGTPPAANGVGPGSASTTWSGGWNAGLDAGSTTPQQGSPGASWLGAGMGFPQPGTDAKPWALGGAPPAASLWQCSSPSVAMAPARSKSTHINQLQSGTSPGASASQLPLPLHRTLTIENGAVWGDAGVSAQKLGTSVPLYSSGRVVGTTKRGVYRVDAVGNLRYKVGANPGAGSLGADDPPHSPSSPSPAGVAAPRLQSLPPSLPPSLPYP